MPVADQVKLSQRATYIFPTGAGFLLAAILVLMMIGATNYQNNMAFLLTFLICGVGLVSILVTFRNLHGLSLKKHAVSEAIAGEPFWVTVAVKTNDGRPREFISMGFEGEAKVLFDCPGDSYTEVPLICSADKRGWFELPRIHIQSTYPFGLLRVWSWFQFHSPVLVYPKAVQPPSAQNYFGDKDGPEGKVTAGSDELYGLRPYQVGDLLSRIDWKSYARERGLNTREFVAYHSDELSFDWRAFADVDFELCISFLTWQVTQAAAKELPYSLRLPGVTIDRDDGPEHLARCLRELALAMPDELSVKESRQVA